MHNYGFVCSSKKSLSFPDPHAILPYWPFVKGIHRSPVDSLHKGPVMWKVFPFGDVIIIWMESAFFPRSPCFIVLLRWLLLRRHTNAHYVKLNSKWNCQTAKDLHTKLPLLETVCWKVSLWYLVNVDWLTGLLVNLKYICNTWKLMWLKNSIQIWLQTDAMIEKPC